MNTQKVTVVVYHYVRDLRKSLNPSIKGLDIQLFREQIGYLKQHYHFVTEADVIEAFSTGMKLPDHPILLTFDDGYMDHFTNVYPILKKENIKGLFFSSAKAVNEHVVLDVNKIHFILASTPDAKIKSLLHEIRLLMELYREEYDLELFDYYYGKLAKKGRYDTAEVIFVKHLLQTELGEDVRKKMTDTLFHKIVGIDEDIFSRELYMSADQMKCMMADGMSIGGHGYNHYRLGELSRDEQRVEIQKTVDFLSGLGVDMNSWTIGYPYGSYNTDTLSLLKEFNCKLGFTVEPDIAVVNNSEDVFLKLPRLDTNDLPKDPGATPNSWYC